MCFSNRTGSSSAGSTSGDSSASLGGANADIRLPGGPAVRRQCSSPSAASTPVSVIARLGRTTAYIDAGTNARLADFGLSRGSWDVLASLRRDGLPYRLSPTQLYLALMRTSGAMTHRLYRLERSGFITRQPDPEDGRGLLVELTPRGVQLVDEVAPAHLANERSLLAALSVEEQIQLADLLRKMLAAFEHEQPTPPPSRRRRRRCQSTQRETRPAAQ